MMNQSAYSQHPTESTSYGGNMTCSGIAMHRLIKIRRTCVVVRLGYFCHTGQFFLLLWWQCGTHVNEGLNLSPSPHCIRKALCQTRH